MNNETQNVSLGHLMDEILEMPEYRLRQQLSGFNISIYIFDQNFLHLYKLIDFLVNDPRGHLLTAERNRDKLEKVQKDVILHLHNFVASSLSLIDHTRRLYRKLYGDSGSFPEYQARIDADFINDSLSQFIKCLRQYCQHYKAPNIGNQVSVENIDGEMIETRQIVLFVDDLNSFDGWNSKAQEYFAGLNEYVDVLEVSTQYREKIIEFYRWFQTRQQEIHKVELDRYNTRQTEFTLLMLEQKINACLTNNEDMPYRGEEVFSGIFSSSDFEELERMEVDHSNRGIRAIELLKKYYPVPDELRQKIISLYKDENFLTPRNWPSDEDVKIENKQSPSLGLIGNKRFVHLRDLSEDEYSNYRKAANDLRRFWSDQELYEIVTWNYQDYVQALDLYSQEHDKNPQEYLHNWNHRNRVNTNINRLLLNYLSAFWNLMDQLSFNLIKRYGQTSDQVRKFETLYSQIYGKYFSFRLLHNLRSYFHRQNLPLTITFELGQNSEENQHNISILFDRNELLRQRDKYEPQFVQEVQNLPPQFEVHSQLVETMECFLLFRNWFIQNDLPSLLEEIKNIEDLVSSSTKEGEAVCIFFNFSDFQEKNKLNYEPIPYEIMDIVKNIESSIATDNKSS